MVYTYEAILPTGRPIVDVAEAPNAATLLEKLKADGLEVVEIRIDWRQSLMASMRRTELKRSVLVDFFSHMRGMLELGMTVTTALETVRDTIDDRLLKEVLGQIIDAASKGYSLSEGVQESGAFPRLAVASIAAAEQSNRLEQVFTDLADHYLQLDELVRNAKKAATYPLIALSVLTMVFTGLLLFVIPQLKDILPPERPLITRAMIGLSDIVGYIWWIPPALPVAAWVAFRQATQSRRAWLVERFYHVPLIGRLGLNIALSSTFMSLAMLNSGGIPLLETLKIVAAGTSSPFLRERLNICRELAAGGMPLSEGFRDPLFPPVVLRAIAHGEATGRFDKQFAGIAKYLRERTANQVQLLSTFIEPVLILVGGTMLLLMALGIFLPIYGSLQTLGR